MPGWSLPYFSTNFGIDSFEAAFDRLSERAVLAGDDVDSSYAFLDVCSRHAKKPMFLIDRRKVFGLVLPTEMVSTDTGRSTG